MKKKFELSNLLFLLIGAALAAALTGGVRWINQKTDSSNRRTAYAYYSGSNVIVDDDGNQWPVYNMNIVPGETYELTFDTKGTEETTDDSIIMVAPTR